ncbi:hypothetical protein SprV_0301321400 [Sparganum proliferum]
MARNKVDIVELTKTQLPEQAQLKRQRGPSVVCSFQNDIVGRLPCLPQGISHRLMCLCLPPRGGKFAIIVDANDPANLYDDFTPSWCTRSETGLNLSALQPFEDTIIMETVQFTEGMVLKELVRPKESKSPGPDEIPANTLKELAGELAKPLSMLFRISFVTGYLPPDWKSAWITPPYKGGSRISANNYRPVSLTSICCKITKKTIKQRLMQSLE